MIEKHVVKSMNIYQYVISIFGKTLLVYFRGRRWGWIRVGKYGIKWKHKSDGLTFSERIGKKKYIRIGAWIFATLPVYGRWQG